MEKDIFLRLIEYGVKKNTKFNLGTALDKMEYDDVEKAALLKEIMERNVLAYDNVTNHIARLHIDRANREPRKIKDMHNNWPYFVGLP